MHPLRPGSMWEGTSLALKVFVATVLSCASLAAQETELVGPARVRDMTPFSILQLDLAPSHGASSKESGWGLEFALTHANTFVMSENVGEFLNERGTRDPLDQADVTAMMQLEGDLFYFDGAISILSTTLHRTFGKRWQGFLTVPVHSYSGGFLDGTIESFHEEFGFSSANRDLTAREQVQLVQRVGGDQFVLLEAPREVGLGDPVVGVRHRFSQTKHWRIVGEAAVKWPVGDVEAFFSSGKVDYGAQLSFQGQWRRHAIFLSFGYVWVGDPDVLRNVEAGDIPTVVAGWEAGLGRRTSVVLQTAWSQSLLEESTQSELTETKLQLTAGLRWRTASRVYTFALTENLANFNNTPDLGMHLGIGFGLARKNR